MSVVPQFDAPAQPAGADAPGFLAGGGRTGARMAAFDWAATPLGPTASWPSALRTTTRLVLDAPFASAVVWGPALTTIHNDAFDAVLGTRDEALGASFRDLRRDAWPTLVPAVDRAFTGEAGIVEDVARPASDDDELGFFTFTCGPVRDDAGNVLGVIVTAVETTRRVVAERDAAQANVALAGEIARRSRERDAAWSHSQDLQLVFDRTGTIRAVNRAWSTMLGWSTDESIGHDLQDFVSRDGEARTSDVATVIDATDAAEPVEICLRHRDGSTRWVSWLTTSEADVIHASGRNVTAERSAAMKLVEAEGQLRQAQKMEAFGQLTGGIAHDFNNLLQAVSGSLEMLGRKHVHNDDGLRLLRLAGQAVDRATHLTSQLLAFARKQSLETRAIDTNAAMESSIELARRSLPEHIAIERAYASDAWPMTGDPNQLDVAMLNLFINARDAMPDGGTVTVSTANVTAPGDGVPADLVPGPYVRVAVSDSGVGMSEDVRTRVFEPFFTTKGVGKGTGLGLSQVYGFAHQSNGSVRVASAAGRGASVEIFLPKAGGAEALRIDDPAPDVWRGRETVLVVDDDRDVRELAVACLEEYGYRVLEAGSGVAGLELLGQEASVDLLLIDYAMPEMNGAETVRLARRMRPDLEVVFITGYADLRALSEHVGPNAIIAKPFKLAQLADRVAKGLARRALTLHHGA